MRKGLKILIISMTVAIILVVALAGTVFAAGGPNSGDCPNPDCPNADCPNDGDGPKYQNSYGPCQNGDGQLRNQYRLCQE